MTRIIEAPVLIIPIGPAPEEPNPPYRAGGAPFEAELNRVVEELREDREAIPNIWDRVKACFCCFQ